MILQKYLRDNLNISRRDAEEAIKLGQVTVNGETAKAGQLIDPDKDVITYDQKPIEPSIKKLIYIVLHKPSGYITSRGDPQDRKTVYDLLPKDFNHLVPIGRLDYETEGLLLLTNDGDLTYQLTHPKHKVEKEYYVELDKSLTDEHKKEIEAGINYSDLVTSPCTINMESDNKLYITLHEGQNREIRRIFTHFGYTVTYLRRVRINNLKLDTLDLALGAWKEINSETI